MGSGSFNNGKFSFVVVAPDSWSVQEKTEWQAQFLSASQALYEATEGQMSFGEIFMADEGWGMGHAEFVLHDFPGTAYATLGGYGTLGLAVQLFERQRTEEPRTIVHEFGHHAFGLADEYTGPVQEDQINTDGNIPPGTLFQTVPLVNSENDSQSLAYGYAILRFGGAIYRMIVNEHTPTQVTVFGSFPADPRTADGERIFYQPQYNYTYPESPNGIQIRCRGLGVNDANYCMMERYNSDQAGTETVSEFCSQDNHDPDGDTAHSAVHGGLSCWELIQAQMQERYDFSVAAPNPAVAGQQTAEFPVFMDLEKEARIALVMDRSGSMGDDNKIQGARFGIEQWINIAHEDNDWLSLTWFNDNPLTQLPLSQIAQADLDPVIAQVNGVDPGGWTNIKDSLLDAAAQIQSRDGRAAVQAIVLLTDGIHNRPLDTTIDQAIPTLQAAGIPVYVIALGTPENVDYAALEKLARDTGGVINEVGLVVGQDDNPLPPEQQNAVIAINISSTNNLIRNGLVQVDDQTVAGAPPDSKFGRAIADARGKRLKLKDLAELQGLDGINGFTRTHQHPNSFTVPFQVEEGATKARVCIHYEQRQVFHLHLIDPAGNPVEFSPGSDAVLIAPKSPFATAIIRKPKPGLWHAVVVRASDGKDTHVFCSAGVENRLIVAHADCDREVPVGMPTTISAGVVWRDRLSNVRVTARLTGPDGSVHNVVLSDETADEPNSGDYRGVFTPQLPGRYAGEVRLVSKGGAIVAGGVHRAVHAPQKERDPAQVDLQSKAPAFVRRVPIYFDSGTRPVPRDRDDRRGKGRPRSPAKTRTTGLKPLNIDAALKLLQNADGVDKEPRD